MLSLRRALRPLEPKAPGAAERRKERARDGELVTFNIHLTKAEKAMLRVVAAHDGVPMSVWLRQRIYEANGRIAG